MHRHDHQSHLVAVTHGRLAVISAGGTRRLIVAGESYWIPAGHAHRLEIVEPFEGVELYVASMGCLYDPGDIDRLSPGWKPGEQP